MPGGFECAACPMQLALVCSLANTAGKPGLLADSFAVCAGTIRSGRRSRKPDALLIALRRLDRGSECRHRYADRWAVASQARASSFVDHSASHSRFQEVQFRFRHYFQAKQKPVVKIRRVIDSILVENERRPPAPEHNSISLCQSAEFRAKRETSNPITSPACREPPH